MPAPLRIQPPKMLRGGLKSVAGDLNALMPVSEWRTGVQYTPQCDIDGFIWGCEGSSVVADDGLKPNTPPGSASDIYPGTLGVRSQCNIGGRQTVIGDVVRQVAEQGLERARYSLLADIMYDGEVGRATPNVSFKTDATVPAGFDPLVPAGIVNTMQGLLDAACTCWDQQLVFHVPVAYLPHFLAKYIVEWDEGAGVYRMGAHLVSFDCYTNLGPDAVDPDDRIPAADGSEVWIYATGAPLIGLDPDIDVHSSILDARINLYNVVAEQGGIVLMDSCCIVGAKAAVCPVSGA